MKIVLSYTVIFLLFAYCVVACVQTFDKQCDDIKRQKHQRDYKVKSIITDKVYYSILSDTYKVGDTIRTPENLEVVLSIGGPK